MMIGVASSFCGSLRPGRQGGGYRHAVRMAGPCASWCPLARVSGMMASNGNPHELKFKHNRCRNN
jgi:hypothetical protein